MSKIMKLLTSKILTISLLLTLGACSSGNKVKSENNVEMLEDGLYLSESDEEGVIELVIPEVDEYTKVQARVEEKANMESLDPGAESIDVESINRSIASIGEEEIIEEEEQIEEDIVADTVEESVNDAVELDQEFKTYEIAENDSLMLVSFKLYQNFDKWKELAKWNNISRYDGNFSIKNMTHLKYKPSTQRVGVWPPEGSPYLIRTGDYLGKISKKVYGGRARFWYDIWKNNELLIKNPNDVYVGFTVFTMPLHSVMAAERERMREYKRRHGKAIPRRFLAGELDPAAKL